MSRTKEELDSLAITIRQKVLTDQQKSSEKFHKRSLLMNSSVGPVAITSIRAFLILGNN
jgi:hypothetical protein